MNFHAVKWKNLEFIRSDRISKCFYAMHCIFSIKVQVKSFIHCLSLCGKYRYTVLEKDLYSDLLKKQI